MNHTVDEMNPPPWWKQFWPWFLISLPAATIVAAMITINLAVETNDGLVSEDYYKDGLAIHRDADALLMARQLGVEADIRFDRAGGLINVDVASTGNQALGTLVLSLNHPTRADRDSRLQLKPVGPSSYQAALPELSATSWNVELGAADAGWQLNGRVNLGETEQLLLK